jgi:hypothetical protein
MVFLEALRRLEFPISSGNKKGQVWQDVSVDTTEREDDAMRNVAPGNLKFEVENRKMEGGRRKKEDGRRKKEEGRRKKEKGKRKKEEGRRKKEEGREKRRRQPQPNSESNVR